MALSGHSVSVVMCRLVNLALLSIVDFLISIPLVMTLGLLDPHLGHRGLCFLAWDYPNVVYPFHFPISSCPPFPSSSPFPSPAPHAHLYMHIDLPFALYG